MLLPFSKSPATAPECKGGDPGCETLNNALAGSVQGAAQLLQLGLTVVGPDRIIMYLVMWERWRQRHASYGPNRLFNDSVNEQLSNSRLTQFSFAYSHFLVFFKRLRTRPGNP